ncbi:zinc finger protein 184-like [Xyrichtys novacula]|uniref:Zinc finger protein 184-like n=1 Tax=Xyrichtys novacula TaxID=13765 RepID=A0AAV1GPN2_XYRNO|nr:zinc finger protein 184-like [Xyrichtys novacula]
MSVAESLRGFVTERLAAATEDILGVLNRTVVQYEEELDRQRRLLDLVWKPHILLHRIDIPQQHDCKEEDEVVSDLQPWNQERNSSPEQEDPEPLQIKEEEEEFCTGQDREQLEPKQETEHLMLTLTCHEPEVMKEDQFLSHNSHEVANQDPQKDKLTESESTSKSEQHPPKKVHKRRSKKTKQPKVHSDPQQGEKTFKCDTNRETFTRNSNLQTHVSVFTGKKKHTCERCGEIFRYKYLLKRHARSHTGNLKMHMRKHTGERPYSCSTCGKSFSVNSSLKEHMLIHSGEKLFTCKTCSKSFVSTGKLRRHMRTHTGERPYSCSTCGKSFSQNSGLKEHMLIHSGEKLHTCETCGKSFVSTGKLRRHMRTHTGERPYSCSTCGKSFSQNSGLKEHMLVHAREKLLTCKTCSKSFNRKDRLKLHMRIHR